MVSEKSKNDYNGFKEKFPEVFRIEPASICNLNCSHCPTGLSIGEDQGLMSLNTFKRIVKDIKDIKLRVVVLYHGGESFLNKNIFKMISSIKSIGIG